MTFKDLLKHKDECCEANELAGMAVEETELAFESAKAHQSLTAENEAAAHQAIHDHLTEFGAHADIDKDGTVTVYTAIDQPPGWRTHHPISGDAEIAAKSVEAVSA